MYHVQTYKHSPARPHCMYSSDSLSPIHAEEVPKTQMGVTVITCVISTGQSTCCWRLRSTLCTSYALHSGNIPVFRMITSVLCLRV